MNPRGSYPNLPPVPSYDIREIHSTSGRTKGGTLTLVAIKNAMYTRVVSRQAKEFKLNLRMYWNTAIIKANIQELLSTIKMT